MKKDEYDLFYDGYEVTEEFDSIEDAIDKLKGTIGRGDCMFCGAKNGMEYEGHICYICKVCGKAVHEDLYYAWAAGYEIKSED